MIKHEFGFVRIQFFSGPTINYFFSSCSVAANKSITAPVHTRLTVVNISSADSSSSAVLQFAVVWLILMRVSVQKWGHQESHWCVIKLKGECSSSCNLFCAAPFFDLSEVLFYPKNSITYANWLKKIIENLIFQRRSKSERLVSQFIS